MLPKALCPECDQPRHTEHGNDGRLQYQRHYAGNHGRRPQPCTGSSWLVEDWEIITLRRVK